MRRFYAAPEQFKENSVQLSLEESRHLRDVLRLRAGDEVYIFDGAGKEFHCRVTETGKGKSVAELELIGEVAPPSPESPLNLTLAIALLKGEKFDLVIQKATELGVTVIIPLQTKRSDIKLKNGEDANKKLERWRRVALEAAKQCGRAVVPEISSPVNFAEFAVAKNDDRTVVLFAERGGENFGELKAEKITAIVGPEGGWDDDELSLAANNGVRIITLGGRILRAETAGIVVTALLQHSMGDLH
jgi:16S rRNA (uracil1498-N3)-methyltransferase